MRRREAGRRAGAASEADGAVPGGSWKRGAREGKPEGGDRLESLEAAEEEEEEEDRWKTKGEQRQS